jgi:hypothetical protein
VALKDTGVTRPNEVAGPDVLIGYWLLAIGYWLLAIGYWLLAIG